MSPTSSLTSAQGDRLEPNPPPGPFPSPLLDATAAGALLGVPESWMLAEARADRIPHVRLGRYVRFDANELAHWWRARARGPWRRIGSDPVANGRKSA
jgi:hypothetical protein